MLNIRRPLLKNTTQNMYYVVDNSSTTVAETNINLTSFNEDGKSTWNYVLFNNGVLNNDAQARNLSLKFIYENGGATGRLSLLNNTWGAGYIKGDWLDCVKQAQSNMNNFVDFLSSIKKKSVFSSPTLFL